MAARKGDSKKMKKTGRAFIKINGEMLGSVPGAKLSLGNMERSTVMGDSGPLGYTEKYSEPAIECAISHDGDTDLTALGKITGASVTFETDTGRVYILRDAWLKNAIELTASESGEVSLQFAGLSCEEVA